jgi:ribonuclease HI
MNPKPTNIYTDGACSGNQNETNLGGWGAVLEYGARRKEIWGAERDTTNNRMEMKALIGALEALTRDGLTINVFSDSSYLIECFRKKWYVKWQGNGWLTTKKDPVENRDLWETLLPYLDRHEINFYRVKGHVSLPDGGAASGGDAASGERTIPGGNAPLRKVYDKFKMWNGDSFSYGDFLHVTEMNNLCDALANRGIDSLR